MGPFSEAAPFKLNIRRRNKENLSSENDRVNPTGGDSMASEDNRYEAEGMNRAIDELREELTNESRGQSNDSPCDGEPLSFQFREKNIFVIYNSSLSYGDVGKAVSSRPFQTWIKKTSRIVGSKSIELYGVEIQNVHFVDGRVDCINMKVTSDLTDEDEEIKNEEIPGVCCLRDSALAILVELYCPEENKIWSLLVDQPRLNVGAISALELPIAFLDEDGENLTGPEAKELEDACGISLKLSDLTNLSQRVYEKDNIHNNSGHCPSLGNCSEFITTMYARIEISRVKLKTLRKRQSEMREDGHKRTLRVVPLDDMWKVSADMKVISALFLLERSEVQAEYQYYDVENTKNKRGIRKRLNGFFKSYMV